ncbi:hypothetical protein Cus16_0356 [Curtobacterium sp. ER1/6]|nr:hypothetical protein Cus16_0356 [Curtobacterium sp. ER1/6]
MSCPLGGQEQTQRDGREARRASGRDVTPQRSPACSDVRPAATSGRRRRPVGGDVRSAATSGRRRRPVGGDVRPSKTDGRQRRPAVSGGRGRWAPCPG